MFTDSRGQRWDVWAVVPEGIERRLQDDTLSKPPSERRQHMEFRVRLGNTWSNGWLAFQCEAERRRLAPIPDNWTALSDAGLEALCEVAVLVDPVRRLVE